MHIKSVGRKCIHLPSLHPGREHFCTNLCDDRAVAAVAAVVVVIVVIKQFNFYYAKVMFDARMVTENLVAKKRNNNSK